MSGEALHFTQGVRLRHEDGASFLLIPEGIVDLSTTASEILELVDGTRSPQDIADALAQRYDAPAEALQTDVFEFCHEMRERGFLK